jgi:DNA ligase-1
MNENDMQHGVDWNGQDIAGYIATEKYNGCRAYWDGETLWSRGGLKINIPDSWRKALPKGVSLDGEIYDGIDGVYRCGAAIRYGRFTPTMQFLVFDCPSADGDYLTRLKSIANYENGPLHVVPYKIICDLSAAKAFLFEVTRRHGEGLMLRNPKLKYTAGRTTGILKFKELVAQ